MFRIIVIFVEDYHHNFWDHQAAKLSIDMIFNNCMGDQFIQNLNVRINFCHYFCYLYAKFSIDQFHRCGHRQAACCEPAGSCDKTTRTAICFEHKTQYLLIRAPYTRIVVFWHISKIPP